MLKEVSSKATAPRYQKIALDIASQIVDGIYHVGDKLYARSSLAGRYGVSPETARRAICVLSDLGIVRSEPGSGVIIISSEKASDYIKQMKDITTISDIENDIEKSMEKQFSEMENLKEQLVELIARIKHYRHVNPIMPFKIDITEKSPLIGKTIANLQFWQNTSATIVAIKRKEEMIVSPGPYAVLRKDDVLFFVGIPEVFVRVKRFIYPDEN